MMTTPKLRLIYLLSKEEIIKMQIEVLRIAARHYAKNVTRLTEEAFSDAYQETMKQVKGATIDEKGKELFTQAEQIWRNIKPKSIPQFN